MRAAFAPTRCMIHVHSGAADETAARHVHTPPHMLYTLLCVWLRLVPPAAARVAGAAPQRVRVEIHSALGVARRVHVRDLVCTPLVVRVNTLLLFLLHDLSRKLTHISATGPRSADERGTYTRHRIAIAYHKP